MGRLGLSESSFKPCKHKLKGVVGLYGINTQMWNDTCPYNPKTDRGNIFSAAWIMRYYLDLSNGNYLEALSHYKSYTPLGKKYAKQVLKG